jgi:hypothetical protein
MKASLETEVSHCDFGDQRLNARVVEVTTKLGQHPTLSIPAALATDDALEAGYRFFDNEKVTPDGILRTHYVRTLERILQERVCLLVQDTSELELTRPTQQVRGAGPLSANSQWGAYLHPLIAFTPQRLNLGTVWQKSWAREKIDTERTAKEKSKYLEQIPIEQKESFRWLEGQREAFKVAQQCSDTQCILVCDSEADIYEVFAETRQTSHARPLELLIRGCQDRATDVNGKHILDTVRATEVLHRMTISVSERKAVTKIETRQRARSRTARSAEVEVYACRVTLRPPWRSDRKLPEITINVVLVEEASPPAGEPAIRWMLLTTLPIDSLEQVLMVIDYYCCRWPIENFFKILKSGCRIEERQFETLERELNVIAVYMIVAWRIHLLCHLGRECPEMDCDALFTESEWKSVYIIRHGQTPPLKPPTLNQMIRMIASLGGYVSNSKTDPGYQTLWIGMQRMRDIASGYEAFGPGSKLYPDQRTKNDSNTCAVR